MGCGCPSKQLTTPPTNVPQLNSQFSAKADHIKLSGNLKISLDQMRNMNIDQIINLYRQGYRLSALADWLPYTLQGTVQQTKQPNPSTDEIPPIPANQLPDEFGFMCRAGLPRDLLQQGAVTDLSATAITSLASAPTIIDAGGSYNSATDKTTALILYTNTGSSGYVEIDTVDNGNGSAKASSIGCTSTRSGLAFGLIQTFAGVPSNSKIDATAYYCSSGENCSATPPTCTTKTSTGTKTGFAIYAYDATAPPAPSMTLTPGDGKITVHWTPPSTSAYIFNYGIACIQGTCTDGGVCGGGTCGTGTIFDQGFLPNTVTSYTFTGLTNGQAYTIELGTLTQSNITGACATMTATPSSGPGISKIVLSPTTATLAVNGTIQLSAICTDSNGNAMTCPSLTVTSSDTTVATFDSATGLIKGIAVGTATITAKDSVTGISCIDPNCSVITVSATPTHRECDSGNICRVVSGPGADQCPAVAVGSPCAGGGGGGGGGIPWVPVALLVTAIILAAATRGRTAKAGS